MKEEERDQLKPQIEAAINELKDAQNRLKLIQNKGNNAQNEEWLKIKYKGLSNIKTCLICVCVYTLAF